MYEPMDISKETAVSHEFFLEHIKEFRDHVDGLTEIIRKAAETDNAILFLKLYNIIKAINTLDACVTAKEALTKVYEDDDMGSLIQLITTVNMDEASWLDRNPKILAWIRKHGNIVE